MSSRPAFISRWLKCRDRQNYRPDMYSSQPYPKFNRQGGIAADITFEYDDLDESSIPESHPTRAEEHIQIESER